jgi:C-5 cytosine-specific DNA methylase
MRVLDLCSGLGGWSAPWLEHHDVTTLDNDPRFGADITGDIREHVTSFEPGSFDVILASPPCELFSTAGWHQHAWAMTGDKKLGTNRYEPLNDNALLALELVQACVAIIQRVRPRAAVIENPRALLRQLGVIPLPHVEVWYCHYGHPYAKPTDLWLYGSAQAISFRGPCHNRRPNHSASCCCHDHNPAPRGSTTGTQGTDTALAAKIPAELARVVMAELVR